MDAHQLAQILIHFDQHIGPLAAEYGTAIYAMLFAIVFCEIGLLPLFFLPGDPLIFICGALCATGILDPWAVIPVLLVATVAGSVIDYRIGRLIGQRAFTGNYRWLDKDALRRSHAFYERHGRITFLLSPYIAVIRTFAPFVAGISQMDFGHFLLSVCGGALLWVVGLVIGGYFFGNVPIIRDHMNAIVLLGMGLGVGALLLGWIYRWFAGPERQ